MGTQLPAKPRGEKEKMYVVGCCCVERVGLIEKVGRRAGAICRPKTLLDVGGPD